MEAAHPMIEKMRQALRLSEELQQLASDNQWQDFPQQLQQRDALLQELAADPSSADMNPAEQQQAAEWFRQIREIQRKVEALAQAAQASNKTELQGKRRSDKAIKSYNAIR